MYKVNVNFVGQDIHELVFDCEDEQDVSVLCFNLSNDPNIYGYTVIQVTEQANEAA